MKFQSLVNRFFTIFIPLLLYCIPSPFLSPLYGAGKTSGTVYDVSTAGTFNIKKGIEPNIFYFDALCRYAGRFAEVTAGMQITCANTDGLFKVLYTPLNSFQHKIGVGVTYHLSNLYTIGSVHDVLASFEYTLTIPDAFIFFAQTGYMHQWLRIPIPYGKTIVIGQSSMTAAVHFTGIIKKEWYLGSGVGSYELFRYPVFALPSFSADLYYRSQGYRLPKGVYLGLEGIVRYSDLLTFSGYPGNVLIKSVIGMEL